MALAFPIDKVSDETPTPATPVDLDPATTGPTRDADLLRRTGREAEAEVLEGDLRKLP
jgi:hypothetical protein